MEEQFWDVQIKGDDFVLMGFMALDRLAPTVEK